VSSNIDDLLPPPLPKVKPGPWRAIAALFVPAAGLAAGAGLQRLVEWPSPDPILQWLCWSSAAGALVGALTGLALQRKLLWAVYGVATPWIAALLVGGVVHAVRPLRETLADQCEANCRAAGRAVCTTQEFTARCAQAHADPSKAKALLGEPRSQSCNGPTCTQQWLYVGPFHPEQYAGAGALACFVLTDAQNHGVRHWLMAADPP
jgi:hypothetical protein